MTAYSIEHVGIAADDPEAVAAWYAVALGFREFFRSAAEPPVIFLEDASGAMLEVFPRKAGERRPGPDARGGLHLAVSVDDFDEAVADLEARGVSFSGGAIDIFAGGRARFFADPEGNRIHIVHRPASPWQGRD